MGAGDPLELEAGCKKRGDDERDGGGNPEHPFTPGDDARPLLLPQPLPLPFSLGRGLALLLRGQFGIPRPGRRGNARKEAGGEVELDAVVALGRNVLLVEARPDGRGLADAAVRDAVALVDPRLGPEPGCGGFVEGEVPGPRGRQRGEGHLQGFVTERGVPLDRPPVEDDQLGPVLGHRARDEPGRSEVRLVGEGVRRRSRTPGAIAREDDVPAPGLDGGDRERDLAPVGEFGRAAAEFGGGRLPLEVEAVHRLVGLPAGPVGDLRPPGGVEDELGLDPLDRALGVRGARRTEQQGGSDQRAQRRKEKSPCAGGRSCSTGWFVTAILSGASDQAVAGIVARCRKFRALRRCGARLSSPAQRDT